jgi:hypothetical protein
LREKGRENRGVGKEAWEIGRGKWGVDDNSFHYIPHRDVTVTVAVPPKLTPFFFPNAVLSEGNRASVTCQILEGDLPVTFR